MRKTSQSPLSYLKPVCDKLECNSSVRRVARLILESVDGKPILKSRTQRGWTGAAIYLASRLEEKKISQTGVSQACRIGLTTLNRFISVLNQEPEVIRCIDRVIEQNLVQEES